MIYKILIVSVLCLVALFFLMISQIIPNSIFVIDDNKKDVLWTSNTEKFSPELIADDVLKGSLFFEEKYISFNARIIDIIEQNNVVIEIDDGQDDVVFLIMTDQRNNFDEG